MADSHPASHARLRRQAGSALYRQVADDLQSRVDRTEFAPGQRLPPEARLADEYGVNRLTVRRALEELARSGVVRTEHGVGSFVVTPATRHRIDDGEASLSESMARRGVSVTHHLLSVAIATRGEADAFPDFAGDAIRFRFVRYLEEKPWSIGDVVIPASLAPNDWDGTTSIFSVLAERHALKVSRAERIFSAGPADAEQADWLDVSVGSPLLRLSGHNTDQHRRIIATLTHYIRGDRAEYAIVLPH
jgi:GntR family transcriptional regulator